MEIILAMFLNTIKMVESSNCKNLNHKIIETGIHKGMSARGCFGLMPNTFKELKKRFPEIKYKLVSIKGKGPIVANQELLARYLAIYLYKRTNGDLEAMAAGWFYGHNLPLDRLKSYKNSNYVSNFNRYLNMNLISKN